MKNHECRVFQHKLIMTDIIISVPRPIEGPYNPWGYVRQEVSRVLYSDNWNSLCCPEKELPPFPHNKYTELKDKKLVIKFEGRVDHRKQLRLYEILSKAWKEIPGFTYEMRHS